MIFSDFYAVNLLHSFSSNLEYEGGILINLCSCPTPRPESVRGNGGWQIHVPAGSHTGTPSYTGCVTENGRF